MFIIIQIPFVDLRLLQKQKSEASFFPNQFANRTNKPVYYRHFGAKHYRNNSENLPTSEHSFFDSYNLLKLNKAVNNAAGWRCRLVFARLFADDFFFHFDIGVRVKANNEGDVLKLMPIIQHFFKEELFVSAKKITSNRKYNLYTLRQYLESVYLYATTYVGRMDSYKNG